MNKNAYRIIFSQARGMFIAVAEIAKSRCKTSGQSTSITIATEQQTMTSTSYKRLNPLNFAVISLLGATIYTLPLTTVANTQIIADKGAPTSQQPTILNSGNGTTQVNIKGPSAGGVSRNTYTQFDVGQKGAILNNSRNNTQTQIGGWVQGNPWLAKGEAKVILNEVNSSNPSQLKGYLEVAGKQAQVVIANPSGLVCDGCGVINADRFTLTTGQAVMNQGYLESFRVRDGQVTIAGKGLDGSLTPFTDIYSRALAVNAGVYANQLNTVLGVNDIQFQGGQFKQDPEFKVVQANTANQAQFSLDVGQMGGMYAGKIFLIGNEHGLGMRNAGSINATTEKLILTANGDLINSGNIIANKDQVSLHAQNINNSGNVSSATSKVDIQSQNLDNSGLISSADELQLTQRQEVKNSGKINAARLALEANQLENSGLIQQTAQQGLELQAAKISNAKGQIGIVASSGSGEPGTPTDPSSPSVEPPKDPTKDGGALAVVPQENTPPKTFEKGYIRVGQELNNDGGQIQASGGIDLDSQNGLDNAGGELSLGQLTLKGEAFKNNSGKLYVNQSDIDVKIFENKLGLLQSRSTLNIQSQTVDNRAGKINSAHDLSLTVAGDLNNNQGQITSGTQVVIQSQGLNNSQGDIEAQDRLNITARGSINNQDAKLISGGTMQLSQHGLDNQTGQIYAKDLQIDNYDKSLNNASGQIVADGNLRVQTGALVNTQAGLLSSQGKLKIESTNIDNQGIIQAQQQLDVVNTGTLVQIKGVISSQDHISIQSQSLSSDAQSAIAAGLNDKGEIDKNKAADLKINTKEGLNSQGQLLASQNVKLIASELDLSEGLVTADQVNITAQSGSIDNQAGRIQAKDLQLNASAQGQSLNNQEGVIDAQVLTLNIDQDIDNQSGVIQQTSTDDLTLQVKGTINNNHGSIQSNANNLSISSKSLFSDAGLINHAGAGVLNIENENLIAVQAKILSQGDLKLDTKRSNLNKSIMSALHGDIHAQTFSNVEGQIVFTAQDGKSSFQIGEILDNRQGMIQASHGLNIAAGDLNNQKGTLQTILGKDSNNSNNPINNNVDLKLVVTGKTENDQGILSSAGQLQLDSTELSNIKGIITSAGDFKLQQQGHFNNREGTLQAKNIDVSAGSMANQQGQIIAKDGAIQLHAQQAIHNGEIVNGEAQAAGFIQAGTSVDIQAGDLINAGLIYAGTESTLNIQQTLQNAGQIAAGRNSDLTIGALEQTVSGSLVAGLKADGTLADVGDLSVLAAEGVTAQGQLIAAGQLNSQARSHQLDQSVVNAKNIVLTSSTGGISANQGHIQATESLNLTAQADLKTESATVSAHHLNVKADNWNNQAGIVQQRGGEVTNITLNGAWNNQNGQFDTQATQTHVTAKGIDNQAGLLQASGQNSGLTLQLGDALNNQQGQIKTTGVFSSQSLGLNNQGGSVLSLGGLDLTAQQLNNQKGQLIEASESPVDNQINVIQSLNNQGGVIQSNANNHIQAGSVNNQAGVIQTLDQSNLDLEIAGLLDNQQEGKIHGHDFTITAGQVANQQGQITAANLGNIQSQSEMNNSQGLIAAQQQLTLNAASVSNNAGQIGSVNQGIALTTTQGQLLNLGGKIQASKTVRLDVQGLDNSQNGLISTSKDANSDIIIDSHQQSVNNQAGQINSAGNLDLQAGAILNQDGLVTSQGDLSLNSLGSINNSQTNNGSDQTISSLGIKALGNVTLQAQQLKNQQGAIISAQNIDLTQNDLNNSASGLISSSKNISIQGQNDAATVNNQAGQISANQNIKIDLGLTASELDNSQHGLILAGEQLDIRSQSILNNQTNTNSSSGLQAKTVHLEAAVIDNTAGQIKAQDLLDVHVTQTLNNTQGLMSSLKQLNVLDDQAQKTLNMINTQGTLIAGQQGVQGADLNINTKSITGDGSLLSQGNLSLDLQDDYTHDKDSQLQAQNNLSISSAGKIKNLGELKSNANLTLKGNAIENAAGAEIESQTTQLDAKSKISNAGLINGGKTYLKAEEIENNAGRIYGDHIAIQANTLSNNAKDGLAPVIASRGDLDLGIQILDNNGNALNPQDGSQIIALGDIRIGGSLDADHQATGQAKEVNNYSSVINANGNIVLNADVVNNKNIYFSTKTETKEEKLNYWNMDIANPRSGNYNPGHQFVLTGEVYNQNPDAFKNLQGYEQVAYTFDSATMAQFMSMPEGYFFIVNDHDDSSAGNMYKGYIILNGQLYATDKYQNYQTTKTTKTEVVDQSAPAIISAGKDLSFNGVIYNDRSQIMIGGELKGDATAIKNADAKGAQIIHEEGVMTPRTGSYGGKGHDKVWPSATQAYNPADIPKEVDLYIYEDPTQVTPLGSTDQTQQLGDHSLKDNAGAQHTGAELNVEQGTAGNQTEKINSDAQSAGQVEGIETENTQGKLNAIEQTEDQQAKAVTGESATLVNGQGAQDKPVNGQQGTIQADGFEIRTLDQNVRLPNNALFKTQPDSKAGYLVETDSKFTNYSQWLSSDYMLNALGIDPALKQKRLGDGYYEQRLIQDQITQLTGRRFLGGYSSDDVQYKALMNNGLTFAQQFDLRPGIALTAAQVAQLSSDIVWMVEKSVTLADGSVEKVLVPQVYVKARVGDLSGDGTLISADRINVKLSDDLNNAGTIAGRDVLKIDSQNINNIAGNLQGGIVDLTTAKDLNNIGGVIKADKAMNLQVKGDLNIRSTTQSTTNQVGDSNYSWTGIDRVAGLYVGKDANVKVTDTTMVLNVGGNTDIKAANISNAGLGKTIIRSEGNVNIGSINTERTNNVVRDPTLFHKDSIAQDVGTQIQTVGNLTVDGKNIIVQGSQLSSEKGTTVLKAKENVEITEGRRIIEQQNQAEFEKKGTLSSSKTSSYSHNNADMALASVVEGNKVIIDANNVNIRGSNIVSDDLTQITAKENVSITAAENQVLSESKDVVNKSGLMSTGGIGISLGKEKDTTVQSNTQVTNTGSSVGSLKGDTTIIAGNHYQQTGSTVSSTEADVNIQAKSVNIEAAKDQQNENYRNEYEKKGLTLAVNVPVVSAVQGAIASTQQVGQSKNDRVNAMAAANAGFDAYKAGQSLAKLKDAASDAGKLADAGVSATLTYGEQKNINERESHSNTASQSQVYAGGKTTIVATGGGDKSDINIIGSDVLGMQGTTLAADHDANIEAAEQNSSEASKNSSKGWNAGVAVSSQAGLAVTAGGNIGKGKGDGQDTSYVNSHVGSAESQTTITSGNATNIIGGQVQGKGVKVDAKELNIESLQDTATYKSKQQNIEGQATVGFGGASVSGSASKSNIDANYASVNEQSGIFAGDDGYQVNVKNNTDLKGAIITSTQTAESLGKNNLSTGTLTTSDIHNSSEYDAKGIGVSGGVNIGGGWDKGGKDKERRATKDVSKSVGFGLDSDKDSSTTHSGINTQNLTIRDEDAQQALTGKTAEQSKVDVFTTVTTDTARENSGAIANNFDKEKVQSEINTQVEVTKRFDQNRQEAKAEINKKIDDAKK